MTAEGASGTAVLDAPRDEDPSMSSDLRTLRAWQCGRSEDDEREVSCDVAPELIVELL